MREAGKIGALALKTCLDAVKPGITTLELDQLAEKLILEKGAEPGFKKVKDYSFTTCININEGIVHGIPNDYVIKEGDLVSIDLGVYYKGFYSDLASTVEVSTHKEDTFLEVGKKTLSRAISMCVSTKRLGDVSNAIQDGIESAGYSVSRDLVGHGIGKKLHESPQIACYGEKNSGPHLKEGMVLAVEVIYQKGSPKLLIAKDQWTLETRDKSLSGLFEHSVLITKKGPEILTKI